MKGAPAPAWQLWAAVAFAAGLWFFCFYLVWGNFWVKISASASLLALLSLRLGGRPPGLSPLGVRELAQGAAAAAVLYGIFWLGRQVSEALFPFAAGQIGAIYGKGGTTPMWVVFCLLLLVTGPSEEIFWRGFLQRRLAERWGGWQGWAAATAVYAGVHVWSMNFMLVGAAAVAGAFWGLLYWRWGRLAPVIVSHSLWSAFIFAVVPVS